MKLSRMLAAKHDYCISGTYQCKAGDLNANRAGCEGSELLLISRVFGGVKSLSGIPC